MNHGTNINLRSDPNGDLTLTNDDGSITIHQNGDITVATLAPIELSGASLGKLDEPGLGGSALPVLAALAKRGKKS